MSGEARERLELIDTLAAGDGQEWPDFWESADQRFIGEMMYGGQADALLASSWLASTVAAAVAAALNDAADEIGRLRHLFDPQSPREQMVRDVLQSVAADLRVRAAGGTE